MSISNSAPTSRGDSNQPVARSNSLLSYDWYPRPDYVPRPPRLIAGHERLVRAYMVNHQWKSLTGKIIVNLYMFVIAYMLFATCNPWYTYFKYLTAWGWTMVQLYFLYTLYLDCLGRWHKQPVSEVATTMAQALSELSFATQVVVSLFFWFCVYPQEPWRRIVWEINMHGMGLLLMVFDYLYRFAGFQLRNLRFVYGFAGFYTVLHVSTVLASGEPIYPGLDFRNVYSFIIFLAGLTTIVTTHKLFYLIHNWARLRQEWKTVLGISAFFLIPRKNSLEVLMSEEGRLGYHLDFDANRFPKIASSASPASNSAREYTTSSSHHDDSWVRDGGGHRDRPAFNTFGSRLKSFAYKEVLSVSPCRQARRAATLTQGPQKN